MTGSRMGSDKPRCCGFLITPSGWLPLLLEMATACSSEWARFPGKKGYVKVAKQSTIPHSLPLAPFWEQEPLSEGWERQGPLKPPQLFSQGAWLYYSLWDLSLHFGFTLVLLKTSKTLGAGSRWSWAQVCAVNHRRKDTKTTDFVLFSLPSFPTAKQKHPSCLLVILK